MYRHKSKYAYSIEVEFWKYEWLGFGSGLVDLYQYKGNNSSNEIVQRVICVSVRSPPLCDVWEPCSSSLSCRLQCPILSFFTPPPTPPCKRRGCVCLCEKHTWQRRRPITLTPPQTDLNPPSVSLPHLLFPRPPSHLFPLPSPRGERWISVCGCWCHFWQPGVWEFRGVNWRDYLTLFTEHADPGVRRWKTKQLLYTCQVLYTDCGKVIL